MTLGIGVNRFCCRSLGEVSLWIFERQRIPSLSAGFVASAALGAGNAWLTQTPETIKQVPEVIPFHAAKWLPLAVFLFLAVGLLAWSPQRWLRSPGANGPFLPVTMCLEHRTYARAKYYDPAFSSGRVVYYVSIKSQHSLKEALHKYFGSGINS